MFQLSAIKLFSHQADGIIGKGNDLFHTAANFVTSTTRTKISRWGVAAEGRAVPLGFSGLVRDNESGATHV
jgi:hypothetical protein